MDEPEKPAGPRFLIPEGAKFAFFRRDDMLKTLENIPGSGVEYWPEGMRRAEELCRVCVTDNAGQRWTIVVDGAVFRAAVPPDFELLVADGGPVPRNWWVEAFTSEQILVWDQGWPDDLEEDPSHQ